MFFSWRTRALAALLTCLAITRASCSEPVSAAATAKVQFPDLYEASILELQEGLDAGHFSSVDLVKVYSSFPGKNSIR